MLKEVEGLSIKELEQIYGVKENALKVRLFRARQRVLKAFDSAQKQRTKREVKGTCEEDEHRTWIRILDRLLGQYRDATAVPEASVHFMPQTLGRIEGRRSFTLRFKRVTQVFVGSAAVICLLFVG